MNYYLFIPFSIILTMFIPIKLRAKISFNLLEMCGAVGIFLFGIKVTHQMIWIKSNKIITKKEKAINTKELDFQGKEILFIKILIKQLVNKTKLKKIELFYNLGIDDAFLSSMIAGYINFILVTFFTKIKNSKPTASLELNDTISYNRKIIQFVFNSFITISLFDIVYSLVRTVILTRKHTNQMLSNKLYQNNTN